MKKIILLIFLSTNLLQAQHAIEVELNSIMDKYKTIGLAVVVVKNNRPIFQKSFGLKNLQSKEALHENDIFRIASISKSFTSTAIMQLVQNNKLRLDDDISQYMGFIVRNPAYPDVKITLKMMLSHTSSLNDSQGYFELSTIDPNNNEEWAKCFNSYRPGDQYEYCNLNFNMLGVVIEKASGERFDQYILNHILKPLELYGGYQISSLDSTKFVTLYNVDNSEKVFQASPNAYHPRNEEIAKYIFGYSTPIFSPTGGMKISAKDLAKYMTMHMNYGKFNTTRVLKKKYSKLMQTPVLQNYGLALLKTTSLIRGEVMVGHTGSAYGLYSSMFFNPKKKFGIVAITNGCKACSGEEFNNLLGEVTRTLYQKLVVK